MAIIDVWMNLLVSNMLRYLVFYHYSYKWELQTVVYSCILGRVAHDIVIYCMQTHLARQDKLRKQLCIPNSQFVAC
jgi:hypothetical protein